jgi:hypothetical protein
MPKRMRKTLEKTAFSHQHSVKCVSQMHEDKEIHHEAIIIRVLRDALISISDFIFLWWEADLFIGIRQVKSRANCREVDAFAQALFID